MQQRNNKTVNLGKRLIVILLSLCLVFTGQETGVFAETTESVSENDIYIEQTKNTEGEENSETVSENEMPSNPTHYCTAKNDGSDRSVWSYVYFGWYPRSMVGDPALKSEINRVISEQDLKNTLDGIDVWVDGVEYRRITRNNCPTDLNFNKVTNETWLYFKWEPIKWKVLQNDGETLFLMADEAIDCKCYHSAGGSVTWKNCTLRSWLNDSFYQEAFNGQERQAIVQQNVENSDSDGTTTDNLYLLSYDDLTNRIYGFCKHNSIDSKSRQVESSDYAYVKGTRGTAENNNCNYWLRGLHQVGIHGMLPYFPYNSSSVFEGIVPAMHIDLSSDLWTITEGGTRDDGGNTDDRDDTDKGDSGEDNKNGGAGTDSSKVKVSSISLSGISKKIAAGKKISLSAEVMPENASNKAVTWTSSNQKYATVDADGVATMKKAGAGKSVTITATANDGSGVYAEYKIKIMKHTVKKVKITAPSKNVKAGGKLKLKASVTTTGKNANKKLKWTSSNEGYATVSSSGVVKASKAGKGKTVTITAMATDGSGKKAKVKIKIK